MILGSIECKALLFQEPWVPQITYVVGEDEMDLLEFWKKYGHEDTHRRAVGVKMDGDEKQFWLIFVADCFSPPLAIVRETEEYCEETFADELTWAHIGLEDLVDYAQLDKDGQALEDYSENVRWNGSGEPYDSEQVMIRGAKLVGVVL